MKSLLYGHKIRYYEKLMNAFADECLRLQEQKKSKETKQTNQNKI
jgi:hypothetical protein